MDTIKIGAKGNAKIIAHRGLSGIETENTRAAFVAAGNRSYFGAECDVHLTADGKYVIFHDDETGRLCAKNVTIEKTPFEKLRSLKFKDGYSRILTLHEYLQIVKKYDKTAVIELKNRMPEGNICEITEICRQVYSLGKIIFISFHFENLLAARRILPAQPMQYLVCDWSDDLPSKLKKHGFGLDIGYSALTRERVLALHRCGAEVNCWTCDDPVAAQNLCDWGVDYITTNILE